MVVAALEGKDISFPDLETLVDDAKQAEVLGLAILVIVTGTRQKEDMIRSVVTPAVTAGLLGLIEVYTRIDVTEINGTTGGEVVKNKAQDFATKLWEKLKGADKAHREAIVGNRIFLLSDTKMSIGPIGERLQPVHKLRTVLTQEDIEPVDTNELREKLPKWWVQHFSQMDTGHGVVIRWSTGNAAVKFVIDKNSGEYDGKYALVYADSVASIVLPHSLVTNEQFWKEYLNYGIEKRDKSLSRHLGASMGILVEDIVEMLRDQPKWGVTIDDINLHLPDAPDGCAPLEYLAQHVMGAPGDVVEAVVSRAISQKTKGEFYLGTRRRRIK